MAYGARPVQANNGPVGTKVARKSSGRDAAAMWLLSKLPGRYPADGTTKPPTHIPASEIIAAGRAAGFSERTLRRAKKLLPHIRSVRGSFGGPWYWTNGEADGLSTSKRHRFRFVRANLIDGWHAKVETPEFASVTFNMMCQVAEFGPDVQRWLLDKAQDAKALRHWLQLLRLEPDLREGFQRLIDRAFRANASEILREFGRAALEAAHDIDATEQP